MGFKRPEVRIFSPRQLEALKINASKFFYHVIIRSRIVINGEKLECTPTTTPTILNPLFP